MTSGRVRVSTFSSSKNRQISAIEFAAGDSSRLRATSVKESLATVYLGIIHNTPNSCSAKLKTYYFYVTA